MDGEPKTLDEAIRALPRAFTWKTDDGVVYEITINPDVLIGEINSRMKYAAMHKGRIYRIIGWSFNKTAFITIKRRNKK